MLIPLDSQQFYPAASWGRSGHTGQIPYLRSKKKGNKKKLIQKLEEASEKHALTPHYNPVFEKLLLLSAWSQIAGCLQEMREVFYSLSSCRGLHPAPLTGNQEVY